MIQATYFVVRAVGTPRAFTGVAILPNLEPGTDVNIKTALTAALTLFSATTINVGAATATGNFNVKITITSTCSVTTGTSEMNFGSVASTATNVTASSTLSVNCTNQTPYTIALDNGTNGSAGPTRNMKGGTGADLTGYQLYRDSARTQVWGSTIGTGGNVYAGTGSGAAQAVSIYGVVATANSPAGNYADTVVATVTY